MPLNGNLASPIHAIFIINIICLFHLTYTALVIYESIEIEIILTFDMLVEYIIGLHYNQLNFWIGHLYFVGIISL
jgi:hypothetical protein